MSRIFDALRKYEKEKSGKNAAPNGAIDFQWADLLTPLDQPKIDLKDVQHITSRPGPEEYVVIRPGSHIMAAEKFRVLRHRLQQMRQHRAIKKLLITSSQPQEGKTSVAVNLASTIALASPRVLLICGDLRSPGAPRVLGLPTMTGLADVLEGSLGWQACLRHIEPQGIYYLAAGQAKRNPVELLQGDMMRKLADEVAELFDWVIIDSPPVNMFADAHCLAMVSDAVLMVARAGRTTPESFQEGLKALADTPLAGVVFSCSENVTGRSYYSKYYKPRSQHDHE